MPFTQIPVHASLPPLIPWSRFSNKYKTLFYKSNIPDIVKNGRFDLVHLHNPMPALEMARVARACKSKGVPYVISTHGFNEIANGRKIYGFDPLRRLIWKHLVERPVAKTVRGAASILALSEADIGIVEDMGFADGDISIVSNGVVMPGIADPQKDLEVYNRLGIQREKLPNGTLTCMFLANHTPNKGLPVLLSAFRALERPFLLIVGGEKRDDVDYQAAIQACGPDQKIVVTGRLSDDEVGAIFRRSDLFVFPTFADTFPLVVLEAMAHGLSVIASRVGGIPHQVSENTGILVEPGDPASLARAIEALADDPGRRAIMGSNARVQVAAKFTWERAAEQAFAAYEKVLRHQASTAPTLANPQFA